MVTMECDGKGDPGVVCLLDARPFHCLFIFRLSSRGWTKIGKPKTGHCCSGKTKPCLDRREPFALECCQETSRVLDASLCSTSPKEWNEAMLE
jgi:hypothetical protein